MKFINKIAQGRKAYVYQGSSSTGQQISRELGGNFATVGTDTVRTGNTQKITHVGVGRFFGKTMTKTVDTKSGRTLGQSGPRRTNKLSIRRHARTNSIQVVDKR